MEFTIYDDDDVAPFLEGLEERPQRKVTPHPSFISVGFCFPASNPVLTYSAFCVPGCSACRRTRRWTGARRADGALREGRAQTPGPARHRNVTQRIKRVERGEVVVVTCHSLNCSTTIISANIGQRDVAFVWVTFTSIQGINSHFFWKIVATCHFFWKHRMGEVIFCQSLKPHCVVCLP